MRYIAIDLGDARTGLAMGDAVTRIVSPLDVIECPRQQCGGDALLDLLERALDQAVSRHARCELVLGLPLNMDGTEGPRSKLVRQFAVKLAERTGRTVHFQDERLTSSEADWSMAQSGMTHGQKKQRRDALAAAAILRDFLNNLTPPTPDED